MLRALSHYKGSLPALRLRAQSRDTVPHCPQAPTTCFQVQVPMPSPLIHRLLEQLTEPKGSVPHVEQCPA